MRLAHILLLFLLVGMISSPAGSAPASTPAAAAQPAGPAYFVFVVQPRPDRFVVEIDSPGMIQHARDVLAGSQDRVHIRGLVVKSPASYNPGWSFHLDPGSISFFDMSIEICDASIQMVEDQLSQVGGAFLPGGNWCPWGSELVGEVAPVVVPQQNVYLPVIGR